MTIRAVFFDAGGTLFRVRGGVGEIYAAHAARVGVAAEPDAIEAGFRTAFRAAPPLAFPDTPPDDLPRRERQWWEQVVRRVFSQHAFGEFDAFFDGLYAAFATAELWEMYPDVPPTLTQLRADGITTGIISNFDSRLVPLLRGLGLDRLIDSITVSSRAGFAKPDPRIFQQALKRHGLQPAEAVHVGDSFDEDIRGAEAAGLRAALVRSGGASDLLEVVQWLRRE